MADQPHREDFYELRHTLEPEQTFVDFQGGLVKLDRSVPGDGSRWYVADWISGSWAYMDSTIEPGDLVARAADPAVSA